MKNSKKWKEFLNWFYSTEIAFSNKDNLLKLINEKVSELDDKECCCKCHREHTDEKC